MKNLNRRDFFKNLATAGSAIFVSNKLLAQIANSCGLTPPQAEGPFYPVLDQQDKDWDLTWVKNKTQTAKGQVVWINGTVTDEHCRPISKALVEIWQAAASGRYNHPGDTSGLALDPNFQYWGRAVTDDKGQYRFRTIVPGHYPAGNGWVRPPHIHFKVFARGFHDLTTQMYFSGNSFPGEKGDFIQSLNEQDRVLSKLSGHEREQVIVEFFDGLGQFDISLRSV